MILILSFDAALIINSDADLDLDTTLNIINQHCNDKTRCKKAIIGFLTLSGSSSCATKITMQLTEFHSIPFQIESYKRS